MDLEHPTDRIFGVPLYRVSYRAAHDPLGLAKDLAGRGLIEAQYRAELRAIDYGPKWGVRLLVRPLLRLQALAWGMIWRPLEWGEENGAIDVFDGASIVDRNYWLALARSFTLNPFTMSERVTIARLKREQREASWALGHRWHTIDLATGE